MAGVPVLGSVVFRGFEVPEQISLGGRQRLAVHDLPGGGRVIDAMGPDEAPIRWSGIFSGQDAAARVRVLEMMRRGGNSWPLSWDAWRFNVIIKEFEAEVSNPFWISYRITLLVIPDVTSGAMDLAITTPSVAELSGLPAAADLSGQIALASAGLGANLLAEKVAASGQLAQLISAQAFLGSKL